MLFPYLSTLYAILPEYEKGPAEAKPFLPTFIESSEWKTRYVTLIVQQALRNLLKGTAAGFHAEDAQPHCHDTRPGTLH